MLIFGNENSKIKLKGIRKKNKECYMKILFISLGCDKNLVDSEVMIGMLNQQGYQMTDVYSL